MSCSRSTKIRSRRSAPGSINSTPLTISPRPVAPIAVAKEIGDKPPEFAVGMILDYRRAHGAAPSGHALTEMLLVAAEPAIRDAAEDPADTAELMKVLRLDRSALEYFAARGLRLAAYAASKKKYGLKD